MKLTRVLPFALPISLALSAAALAQVPSDQVRLGQPSYGGTGCPNGSVSAVLSPDAQSLSLLFDQFQVEAGGSSGKNSDRKACNIGIPVTVPQGFSVSILKIDYRGYHRIPTNASGTFDVEYFFAGQQGPAYHKSFNGYVDGNFTLNNELIATATVWSACGADVNLRTNTSLAIQSNGYNEETMLTLDSADITSSMVYHLQWKRCDGRTPAPYPTPYPTPVQYPTPYPTPVQYPTPAPQQLGACVINQQMDARRMVTYTVQDGYGRIVVNTVQYAQAVQQAQASQARGQCYGIIDNIARAGQTGQPRQPYPQPQRMNSCQIMNGGNARGQILYRVVDRAGRIVASTSDYNQAVYVQQSDQRCLQ